MAEYSGRELIFKQFLNEGSGYYVVVQLNLRRKKRMTEYERGFIDGIKSKVSAELTPTLINVSRTMLEMLKPVLSTALENVLNDNNAIADTDVQSVDRWINVDDRLPEEIGYYLVVIGNEMLISIDIAEYSEGYWHKHDKVLYWQPLPELPKEG